MSDSKERKVSLEQYEKIIHALSPCMDDYLYVYDLVNDVYCISPTAVERFRLPASRFTNVNEHLKELTHPDDWYTLSHDISKIFSDANYSFHNLQYRWTNRMGEAVWISCRGRLVRNENGDPIALVGCINEIGEKQRADNISGLRGEAFLKEDLVKYVNKDNGAFLIRFGIDEFREIVENFGPEYGEKVLKKTSDCISECVGKNQKLYKLDGTDEFMVLDYNRYNVDSAHALYEMVANKVTAFIEESHYEVFFTVSAGAVDVEESEGMNYNELMKLTEFALGRTREVSGTAFYVYKDKDYRDFVRKRKILQVLRKSVDDGFNGFTTLFQPIIDIESGRFSHAETLLRFNTPETGPLSPMEFIPILEESGLIIPVGKWVLSQAIYACTYMQKFLPDFHVSFNLSYVQVLKSNVLSEIIKVMKESGLKMGNLVVELTESGFVESNENFISFCEGLRKYGISIALDDFGTGYSNFHYLFNLTPDVIKIDRSFTLKALKNDYEYNLLKYLAQMAHSINSKFCIEGIETEEELERIKHIGPDYIQGYYFGKPMSLADFEHKFAKVQ